MTTGDPPRLRKLRRDAPRDLVTIVEKAIDKDPARRYQTAGALADDLQRFLDGRPIPPGGRRAGAAVDVGAATPDHRALGGVLAVRAGLVTIASVTLVAAACSDLEKEERRTGTNEGRAAVPSGTCNCAQAEQATKKSAEEAEGDGRGQLREARKAERKRKQQARADNEAEVARRNLCRQMHLALRAWREQRGLARICGLLASWLPPGRVARPPWLGVVLPQLAPLPKPADLYGERAPARGPHRGVASPSKRLAEGTADGLIRIWDVDREQTTLTLRATGALGAILGGVRWLGWSPDGGRLVAGCKDGTVHVWETGSGREVRVLRGHKSPVNSVAYSSDGTRVAAWGQDGDDQGLGCRHGPVDRRRGPSHRVRSGRVSAGRGVRTTSSSPPGMTTGR